MVNFYLKIQPLMEGLRHGVIGILFWAQKSNYLCLFMGYLGDLDEIR